MADKSRKIFATQIGNLVPKIAKASFERFGFAYANLASKWEAIIGKPLCEFCHPKKIVWPRGTKNENDRVGGTLHLMCLSAHALDLQHQQQEIIERINRFYGYKAISAVNFFQTSHLKEKKDPPAAPPSLSPEETSRLRKSLEAVSDPKLAQTLERLGGHILRAQSKKKRSS